MANFTQANKLNLSEQIAEQIENVILTRELNVGDKLPGEIELAEQFGASRNVLREAFKTLQERGLIEIKAGSGAFVAQPSPLALQDMVNRIVTLSDIPSFEIYAVRMALEVPSCGLAAVNATSEDIAVLESIIEKMQNHYEKDDQWARNEYKFHLKIADMTNTQMFPILLRPLIKIVFDLTKNEPLPLEARKGGLRDHMRILEALKKGDQKEAENAMAAHLKDFLNDRISNPTSDIEVVE